MVLINDCYNANPMSMRAALDDLAADAPPARRVAVLGDMLELGADEPRFHRELGEHATARGVELLVTVGPLAARDARGASPASAHSRRGCAGRRRAARATLLRDGDTVLVKGSRGVGLERVPRRSAARAEPPLGSAQVRASLAPGWAR